MNLARRLRACAHKLNRTPHRSPQQSTFRPHIEGLEDRTVPAVVTVTNTFDTTTTGDGVSLREAIQSINAGADIDADVIHSGTYGINDTITFAIPTNDPGTSTTATRCSRPGESCQRCARVHAGSRWSHPHHQRLATRGCGRRGSWQHHRPELGPQLVAHPTHIG